MRRVAATGMGDLLRDVPWVWLVPAGVLLPAVVLLLIPLADSAAATASTCRREVVGGKLVPGHVEPAPKPQR